MQIKRIALGGIIMNVIMLVGVAQQSRTWQSGKKKRWKQEKQSLRFLPFIVLLLLWD